MKNTLHASISGNRWDGTGIHIFERNQLGDLVGVAQPIVIEKVEHQGEAFRPAILLPIAQQGLLQEIVDQAWDMGIRPRYAKETVPEVTAIKYHLEDMRRLVFKGKTP
jgi:hypothetical protein